MPVSPTRRRRGSPHLRRLPGRVSDQMDIEANEHPKQERLRTRWTTSLDKIFVDLVVQQVQSGTRRNNVFDKKTWNLIRNEFNKQIDLNFNNNQLRKHLDVLRTRYYNLKSASDLNDFSMDDSFCIGFDSWEDKKPEIPKIKDCPIFEQLCTIFADSGVDGKYAQSNHYEELDRKFVTNPVELTAFPKIETPHAKTPSSKSMQGSPPLAENMCKDRTERKRKRAAETGSYSDQRKRNEEIHEAMASAMLEMVAASKLHAVSMPNQSSKMFTITNCIKALDEIEGLEDRVYYAALDLFENPNLREIFLSLKEIRTAKNKGLSNFRATMHNFCRLRSRWKIRTIKPELDRKVVTNPGNLLTLPEIKTPSFKSVQESPPLAENVCKDRTDRKRKRAAETSSYSDQRKRDGEIHEAMASAMLEMVAASKLHAVSMPNQSIQKFTITNCIKFLDEIAVFYCNF